MEKWRNQARLLKVIPLISYEIMGRFFLIGKFILLIGFGCSERHKPPNILFIAIDDLRPELGCYGVDYVKSPNIDKLAAEGITFGRAYCSVSWCSPSRTSLMTGLRPSATGVMDLKTHFREKVPDHVTLPQFFKNQGYTSLGFGKLYHNDLAMQDDSSWTVHCWLPPGPAPIQAYATEENQKIANTSPGYKSTATEKADVPDNTYPDGQVTDQAVAALKTLKDDESPFFLGVGYYKPHLPFTAPAKYWVLYESEAISLAENNKTPKNSSPYMFRSWSEPGSYLDIDEKEPYSDSLSRHLKHGYFTCVSFIDAQVGKLIDELERLGLSDNTIVVIWGDHGWKLGEHGRWSKHSNMEIDTRVPLIISIPGRIPRREENIVETIDIYPTLVALAGFDIPKNLQGESLLEKTKDYAISQIPRDSIIGNSLRTPDYRFIEWRDQEGKTVDLELYDHRENHDESINLVNDTIFSTVIDAHKNKLFQIFNNEFEKNL
jgi:iduronate 2-sulfatase